ncbi:MAG: T9SS type A sorting domain-containing protein [Bacteroidota bacterium]|nr:T9SS type A sorting domain-containing protein [Bacteroidota bacterium]
MKHIQLLFSISVWLIVSSIKSQSFVDSSNYYTFATAPSLSPQTSFTHYIKEYLFLDSSNTKGDFFSVHYSSNINLDSFNSIYYIKKKDNKVYFTGKLYKIEMSDSFDVSDLLIYDFNLNTGDTLKIKHSESGINLELLIDSIQNVVYKDGISRETHFYKVLESNYEYIGFPITFSAKGLGSDFGLLPFKLNRRNSPFSQKTISVCEKDDKTIFQNNNHYNIWKNLNYCDEQVVKKYIDTIRSTSFNEINIQAIKIYPNPANQFLNITSSNHSLVLVEIKNHLGQMVYNGTYTPQIDISLFKNGIYFLFLKDELGMIYKHKLSVLK